MVELVVVEAVVGEAMSGGCGDGDGDDGDVGADREIGSEHVLLGQSLQDFESDGALDRVPAWVSKHRLPLKIEVEREFS